LDRRHLAQHCLGGRDAVHIGHVDVHQNDIRLVLLRHCYRFAPSASFRDNLNILFEKLQLFEVIARLGDVIDD